MNVYIPTNEMLYICKFLTAIFPFYNVIKIISLMSLCPYTYKTIIGL